MEVGCDLPSAVALAEASKPAESVFDHSLIAMALVSIDGRLVQVNNTCCDLLGYSAGALPGQSLSELVPAEDWPVLADVISRLAAGADQQLRREQRFRHSNGSVVWGHIGLSVAPGSEGGVCFLQIQDISEFKRTERELEKSQHMLSTLMSNLPGMAYRCRFDTAHRMEFVSNGCLELTGHDSSELIEQGATPYAGLINPEDRESIREQLSAISHERPSYQIIYRLTTKTGDERWVKEQGRGVFSGECEIVAFEGLVTDVTKSQRLARKLAYQAAHDDLTGLVNRREFEDRLSKALSHTKHFGVPHALCYLDLDQFKIINDTVGHRAGDELLRQIAGLLNSKIRSRDTLARLGGDEFGLLLENCPVEKARALAETLVEDVREFRFVWESQIFQIGVSIGLVPIGADSDSVEQLLSRADVSCYTAKDLGRNRVHVYEVQDAELVRRHSELQSVASLRDALDNNRLHLYRQPIKSLTADRDEALHYEILLRMADKNGNLMPPGAFIPAAERYGLMETIDKWVISTVLRNYCELFGGAVDVRLAINLSGNSLNDELLLGFVKQQLAESAVAPQLICFEITETAVVSNMAQASRFIAEMKRLGCRFALDDFGSGLSSFAYLKYFPVDYLKIDGGFVRDMVHDATDHAMVTAINEIGHVMGIQTIAEYVETPEIIDALRKLRVDYAQGYAIGEPTPLLQLDPPSQPNVAGP